MQATEVATPVHQALMPGDGSKCMPVSVRLHASAWWISWKVLVKYNPGEFLATLHAVLEQEMGQEGSLAFSTLWNLGVMAVMLRGDMRRVLVVFPTVRWLQPVAEFLKQRVAQ